MDKFTVRDSVGSVDVEASVAAYTQVLKQWVAENEVPVDRIARAVDTVFDNKPNARLPTPFLVSLAVQELNADPMLFKTLSLRVTDYIKGQCANGAFTVTKGKGGGVMRRSSTLDSSDQE